MNKVMEFLERWLLPVAEKLNNNRYLTALRDGFMVALPVIIFGSIFVVIANFPFLDRLLGEEAYAAYQNALGPASAATLSLMGLFVIVGIGYKLTEHYGGQAIYGGVVAIASFLILTPQTVEKVTGAIPTSSLGAQGLFLGIFTAIISAELYRFFVNKNWVIKMPAGVPEAVSRSFSSLIPIGLTLTVFLLVRILFSYTPYETVQNFIYTVIQQPLTKLGSGLGATIVAVILIQIFWFFGLHGQIIVNTVFDPIWYALNDENFQAFQAGRELPNVITKQFIDTFLVGMGGSGMTLAVVILIFLIGRSRQVKELGKLGGPPGIFNVNEPITFGLPIILNPLALIPWILAPVVVTVITYFAMASGLVPKPAGIIVPWTTPIGISGFLATGNAWQGAVLQIFNLLVVMAIWWPFLKIIDKSYYEKENKPSE
ncbi:PTS cellobiose transporter subunit IIC [Caldibacillus debilis]|jgi:PTS system cellobiose-specific IIC component|uniref:Permease IIC component n=1 Tax=Caldibacillus debilis GB1 TaxID=1339248 RepID=A0A420VF78_9BACI|nr:PTS cellobiose transporter subunit IIC [Caldibacillus debilis]MBO2482432.1 PTS system, cellobiose-specific IIC component [Bacillaceae bacterium]MBY6270740.1 PTS system, cellobiose-specific IIC component [Bacillaceae bacterium]REJ28813.1 MAG: PTS cellobiose transporter subunit IIC [Caldibacillus debilis]RKO62332.1 phosphotransferase system, cellobiose specific, IIC component [Caldibacillus debilis GB1]